MNEEIRSITSTGFQISCSQFAICKAFLQFAKAFWHFFENLRIAKIRVIY